MLPPFALNCEYQVKKVGSNLLEAVFSLHPNSTVIYYWMFFRPQSAGETGKTTPKLNRSLPEMPGPHRDSITSFTMTSPNVYPLHLLLTTNYRLPIDVDRNNLEKHLTDADFDHVFRWQSLKLKILYWKSFFSLIRQYGTAGEKCFVEQASYNSNWLNLSKFRSIAIMSFSNKIQFGLR